MHSRLSGLFLSFALLAAPALPASAALGWVGNMFPAGGSLSSSTIGSDFTVYVQVWKNGVTNLPGQGANIECTLHWGRVSQFGGAWTQITDTPMTYNVDIGNNDEYVVSISPFEGMYEFTANCTDTTDSSTTWQQGGNGKLSVIPAGTAIAATALWINEDTIAWDTTHGPAGVSYELHYDMAGNLEIPVTAGSGIPLAFDSFLDSSSFAKFPNANGYKSLKLAAGDLPTVPEILKSEMAIAVYDNGGEFLEATGIQIQGVLDDLYSYGGDLGLTWANGIPTFRVWAPTAHSVEFVRYNPPSVFEDAMTLDPATGAWSYTGESGWEGQLYEFDVEVFVPETGNIEINRVTDPYSLTLTRNGGQSVIIDLDDPALKPAGWDQLSKPPLDAPEDITIYEMHVRDFSVNDSVVAANHQGRFKAFTYDGVSNPLSNGMAHLKNMQESGLTHVHLLPVFDIANVNEDPSVRSDPDPALLETYPPDSDQQQAAVGATRGVDSYNWGYDPIHYGVPEGSYATLTLTPTARVFEFREMVKALADNGLRVVMDVAYNHTHSRGQFPLSVLDKIVPGYYHRLSHDGFITTDSCCNDTASEFDMMRRLMIDTVMRWARDYKVDGFRFDLMSFHTREDMEAVRGAVDQLTLAEHGVDGKKVYMYGEAWDTGSLKAKGFVHANQFNMAGAGIGSFNDRIRDATHGGFNAFLDQQRRQGFINGQAYDWNGYLYAERFQSDLRFSADRLRIALAGNLQNYGIVDQNNIPVNGLQLSGTGYTLDPQEAIQYVTKHDNETLYDLNIYKLPWGNGGTPFTSMADRVRAQNLGLSLSGLAQGVPFFHAGVDMLRSKSLDSNSFDSGDWFNKLDFTYQSNNYASGLPPEWTSVGRWPVQAPLLADAGLLPANADIVSSVEHMKEILAIRKSSKLFRLETESDVIARMQYHNMGSGQLDALIAYSLDDTTGTDLDPLHERIVVVFNANKFQQTVAIGAFAGSNFVLHPVQAASHDSVVKTASYDGASGSFTVPARTTAVFVLPDAVDTDGDGVTDATDNCTEVANPAQCDGDGDGYGNSCDADFDNSGGIVNFGDLALFKDAFGTENADADLDCSGGIVNFGDLAVFGDRFGQAPGPSALVTQ